ncbi:hypothetical protein [Enterobacter hormaechei]|uniref:hypothetical protein n=1 Tax=Enterobacter hormaechei TaxID=158836 RepID=UPI003F55FEBA
MELSRDKIKEIINDDWLLMDDCEGNKNCDVVKELARIALASLEAEPVAYVIQDRYERQNDDPGHLSRSHVTKYVSDDDIQEHEITCTPLYTAPPAPVSVPTSEEWCESTEQKPVGWVRDAMKEAYNGCRTAMLQGAEPVSNRDELTDAVNGLLAAMDEYPERLVPINRDSAVVRQLRAAAGD